MATLRLYAPAFVLILWAGTAAASGEESVAVLFLPLVIVAFGVHLAEDRRRRGRA